MVLDYSLYVQCLFTFSCYVYSSRVLPDDSVGYW